MKISRWHFLLFTMGLFVCLCPYKALSASNIDVSLPTQISSNSYYERNPSIFKDASGKYWLFYTRDDTCTENHTNCNVDNDLYMIYYQTSDDGGATWSGPTLLDKTRPNEGATKKFYQREVSAFQDNAGKIWVFASSGDSGQCRHLIYYTTTDGGASWTDADGVALQGEANDPNCNCGIAGGCAAPPQPTGTRMGHANVIYANNKFWLVYQTSGGSIIRFSSSDDGATWTAPGQIYAGSHYVPKIFYDSGTLRVVTTHSAGQVWLASSVNNGATWSTAQIAGSGDPWGDWDPSITRLSNDNLLVMWAPNVGADGQQLKAIFSEDDGVTWSQAKAVTAGTYLAEEWWDYWPTLFVDGGSTFVFYSSEQDFEGKALDGGDIWMTEIDWNINNNHHFGTIQQAIDFASAGDTINVASGTYVITNAVVADIDISVNLIGAGASDVILRREGAGGTSVVLVDTASGVLIRGFTIDADDESNRSGIKINDSSDSTIDQNTFINFSSDAIFIGPNSDDIIVKRNTFTGSADSNSAVNISDNSGSNTVGSDVASEGNIITMPSSGAGNRYGVHFSNSNSKNNTVQNNVIDGVKRAIQQDVGVSGTNTVQFNNFFNIDSDVAVNNGSDVAVNNDSAAFLNTINNYWCSSSGPAINEDCGYLGNVTYDPFLLAPYPTAITLTPLSAQISIGSTLQYETTGFIRDGTSVDVILECVFTSRDTDIATISESGLATGVSSGSTVIDANCFNDLYSKSAALSVAASEDQDKPLANAGPDRDGFVGDSIILDGSGSSDPLSRLLTYRWIESSSNPETGLIDDPTLSIMTIVPMVSGNHEFSLIVNNGVKDSDEDEVSVFIIEISVSGDVFLGGGGCSLATDDRNKVTGKSTTLFIMLGTIICLLQKNKFAQRN